MRMAERGRPVQVPVKRGGKGALELRGGKCPAGSPRYGRRVRAGARIQVEPRTVSVRPEPVGSGRFVYFLPLWPTISILRVRSVSS